MQMNLLIEILFNRDAGWPYTTQTQSYQMFYDFKCGQQAMYSLNHSDMFEGGQCQCHTQQIVMFICVSRGVGFTFAQNSLDVKAKCGRWYIYMHRTISIRNFDCHILSPEVMKNFTFNFVRS